MTLSVHQIASPLFIGRLKGLAGVLDKALADVAARKLDPQALLGARLYPDMFPFTRQVQIACDFAKGAMARLAGEPVPPWADTETSFEELKARVEKTIAYVEGLAPAKFEGAEGRDVVLTRNGESTTHNALAYLLQQALPNFFFHVTTAYAILRHNGVAVGKKDYIG